jgi:hypothetical protein
MIGSRGRLNLVARAPGANPRARNYQGANLLANSFRPFFLFGAIQAGLSILVWLPVFYGELSLTSAFVPRDWHVHEMLYGYLPAAITGFLFTAIPTGPGGCRFAACLCSYWSWSGLRDGWRSRFRRGHLVGRADRRRGLFGAGRCGGRA